MTAVAPILIVARWTIIEAVRRRMVLVAALLSVAFVALFAVGFVLLYGMAEQQMGTTQPGAATGGGLLAIAVVLTVLGLYAVQFLAALLALFLGVGSLSAEIDSGALHAVLARPISRTQYVLGRFGAFAALLAAYCVAMAGSLLLVARLVAGYQALNPARTIALVVLEMVVLLAVGTLGSTRLPTLANGVLMFSLFGLAWLAGIVEYIGGLARNETMVNLGTAISLVFPSDAVWRGASFYAQPASFLAVTGNVGSQASLPFAANAPMAGAMFGVGARLSGVVHRLGPARLRPARPVTRAGGWGSYSGGSGARCGGNGATAATLGSGRRVGTKGREDRRAYEPTGSNDCRYPAIFPTALDPPGDLPNHARGARVDVRPGPAYGTGVRDRRTSADRDGIRLPPSDAAR